MLVSGDEDLPAREDLGERRKKHELQILKRLRDDDEADVDVDDDGEENTEEVQGSEDEFYREVKQQRAACISAKKDKKLRYISPVPSSAKDEEETLGEHNRRRITYEMEKNRGLTRYRKKLTKTARKKYKLKHQKAVVRRKGQVREARRPSGPYGGEVSGINVNISHSVRFH
ncbi:hypothetical protein AMTR_s00032p00138740 [Amborella trichopoda]|uniref:Sas10 C-terminal domain-containing protein n=1 Tax=Amborella trichopoda TaxID=13333 RepID=U5D3A8_AMBTC|nr:hypothetical protein AMTR_s00032p00138740 [Amborella trichopoda]